eukprot:3455_1
MRLIAHNMLRSNIKGVEKGYPLQIVVYQSEVVEMEFDGDFVRSLLEQKGRIDWNGLIVGCQALGIQDEPEYCLPVDGWKEDMLEDNEFLLRLHHALFEVVAMSLILSSSMDVSILLVN